MNETKVTHRLHYFDLAKGFLILGLMISHFGIMIKWAGVPNSPYFSPLYTVQPLYIFFFMQCFLFVSGYCSSFEGSMKTFLIKQIRQIVVPSLFFSVIFFLNTWVSRGWTALCNDIINFRFSYFWFLNALFISKIIVYLLRRFVNKEVLGLLMALLLMIVGVFVHQFSIGSNVLCYQHGLMAVFFVAFGAFCKDKPMLFDKLMKISLFVYPLFLCYYHFIGMLPKQDALIEVTLLNVPVFIVVSLSGTFALLQICKWINKCNVIEYFGRNSIVIYCIHTIPFVYILKFVFFHTSLNTDSMFETFLFLLVVYGLLMTSLVLSIYALNLKYLRPLIGKQV